MKCQYDLKGHIYIFRSNGEIICLSPYEVMEVVEVAIDTASMPFDKDEIYRHTADSLKLEHLY